MLGAIFAQVFREFQKVLKDFSRILEDFARVLWDFPGFSPKQNFWGCCCTPASYTSDSNLHISSFKFPSRLFNQISHQNFDRKYRFHVSIFIHPQS